VADKQMLDRLGARIRKLRKQRGWSQVVMAERIGIDRSFLADIERGKRNVSIGTLDIIAKGLNRSLAQLLSGV